MKKIIALLLALAMAASFSGCQAAKAESLMENADHASTGAGAGEPVSDDDAGSIAADFSVRLFQESLEPGENTLISPLSVLCALAMTANGAEGENLAQMEAVLGMPVEDLNSFLLEYRDSLPQGELYKLYLANAIWLRDDPNLTVKEAFLQANTDSFGADIYKAPFDDGTLKEINGWVNEKTDGMIPDILDEIPENALMYLVNALAFDAQWETVYREDQVREGVFTTEDGVQRQVSFMHSVEGEYLEDDNATGFIKYYANRNYAFVALLPKEGISVEDYAAGLTGAHLIELLSDPEAVPVSAAMPKFETEYDVEMSEILKSMGMADAFDSTKANFSGLGSSPEGNLFISRVLHKTFLTVDEQGTKAGAATAVEIEFGAAVAQETKTVTLDRPFVYLLIDCEHNLPFFIGTMMDISAEG